MAHKSFLAGVIPLSLALAALVTGCGGPSPGEPTAKVERATVATSVSASGALAAVTSQNLGFAKAGQISQLNVKVGDHVTKGQTLARQDPFTLQQTLNQQQAQLDKELATLEKLERSPTVHGDKRGVDQQQKILDATRREREATLDKDENAVQQQERTLATRQRQFDQARTAYQKCRRGLVGSATSGLGSALSAGDSSSSDESDDSDSSSSSCGTEKTSRNTATDNLNTARNDLETAEHTLKVDKASQEVSVENARQNLVSAQNTLASDRSDRDPDIDAQAAVVAQYRAAVANAQRDMDNTALVAPVDGTISAISGAPGEWVNASSNNSNVTSALAPGSNAAIPGVGAAATSDQAGNAGGSLSATRPSGNSFIVMNDLDTYQLVVPFEESDAAKIRPNQKVRVTFDAIPDLEREGTVLSVAPGGVSISGVTNYYATVLLTQTDSRLKTGLTGEARVHIQELPDVLTVPNSAIIKENDKSYVKIVTSTGETRQQEFQPGTAGDDRTQVISGLIEGQQVLTTPTTQPTTK